MVVGVEEQTGGWSLWDPLEPAVGVIEPSLSLSIAVGLPAMGLPLQLLSREQRLELEEE